MSSPKTVENLFDRQSALEEELDGSQIEERVPFELLLSMSGGMN